MLKISKKSETRVDIELDGKIDAAEMAAGLDDLIAQSKDVSDGRMLYTITNFSMPEFAALGVELARLPALFTLLSRFTKCAVLCDTAWLRTMAEFEGALVPGLQIKGFVLSGADDAEAWLKPDNVHL